MFYKNERNIINPKITDKLTQLDLIIRKEEIQKLKSNKFNKESNILVASQISAIASNELEDITISIYESVETNNNVQQLINNYNEILSYIKNHYQSIIINNSELLSWHKLLFSGTFQQTSVGGKFKNTCNCVVDSNNNILLKGIEPWQTPEAIQQLNDWYWNNKSLPPLIKLIIYNFDFLSIHPFNDGNGRISRLLLNYMLIQNGYDIFQVISLEELILKHKSEYLHSLKSCNQGWQEGTNTYDPYILFILDIIIKAYSSLENS